MPFKMKYSNSSFPFKQTGKTAIEAIKGVDKTKDMDGSERDIYLAKLRGDYQDLTGGKLKEISYDDPTETVVSKDPEGPITGN
jgi:hypothetical protein